MNEKRHELPPSFQVTEMMLSLWVPQAVHAAASLGIADALGEMSLSSLELAHRLQAEHEPLRRLLKALVLLDLCSRDTEGRYRLTATGSCLRADAPDTVRSWALLMGGSTGWSAWSRLPECVRTGDNAWKLDGTDAFRWLQEHPEEATVFNQAMQEISRRTAAAVAEAYDFAGVERIVDVGGGYGALLAAVLERHSAIEGTVLDLPHCREGAERLFRERGLSQRARFVAGDFLESVVDGADLYLLKSVIHDWNDAKSIEILRCCRWAMKDSAKLLLIEPIVPDEVGESPFDDILVASDLNMLVHTGGKERTESEFRALFGPAGLKLERALPTPSAMRVFELLPV